MTQQQPQQAKIDDRFAKFMSCSSLSEFEKAQIKKIVKDAQIKKQ